MGTPEPRSSRTTAVASGAPTLDARPARRGAPVLGAALALAVAAPVTLLYGAALIGLGSADATVLVGLGLVVLLGALGVSHRHSARIAARSALAAGVLVTAAGAAVAWLGHLGQLEMIVCLGLLLTGIGGTTATPRRAARSSPRRVLAVVLLAAGSTAVIAGVAGIGGEYLRSRIDASGFDCLQGFSGDPSRYPDAPATASAIRTGFSWSPIGRTCSWAAGLPAASEGATTAATVDHQGDVATSDWIYRTTIGGLVVLIASVLPLRRSAP